MFFPGRIGFPVTSYDVSFEEDRYEKPDVSCGVDCSIFGWWA